MHVKRTATIVVVGGALVAWLAGAATSNRALPDPIIPRPAPIDTRGTELANEIARLHERLRPSAAPRTPSRNLFTFHAAPAPATPIPAPARAALIEAPFAAVLGPPTPLKLSGISEDPGPDGTIRVAFIAAGPQFFMVKEGEPVTSRYRVVAISSDVVELIDLTDNTTRRLALR